MSQLVAAHLEHLRALGRSPKTIEERGYVLRRLHAALPFGIAYASTTELEQWLGNLTSAGRGAWTLTTYAMHIRGFFRWADGRFLDGDPAGELGKANRPRLVPNPITDDELREILARSDRWWRRVVLMVALEGLRASEVAQLRREDVTQETIRIRRAKGGDPASIPTHPRVWSLVCEEEPGPLVGDRRGRSMTGHRLTIRARQHFDELGMPEVHLHRIRHWFATALLRKGVDVRIVQELMRHRSITSTQGYTLVVSEQRTQALSLLTV